MNKQPYVYTMPESFLKDQEVPARWRVWAVINGFFINRQKCWMSNDRLGDIIGAHKDTASQAVKELEDLGIIVCERTRRSRIISLKMLEIGVDAYQEGGSTPISDRHEHLSNSYSNSDSLILTSSKDEDDSEDIKIEPDEDSLPNRGLSKRKPPDKNSRSIMNWAEERNKQRFPNPLKQMSTIKTMLSLGFTDIQIKEKWAELETDPFWGERGIDFGTVLANIGKKRSANFSKKIKEF